MKAYLLNVFVWFSQTLNVIFLAGHPDQTVSARAFLHRFHPVWGKLYYAFNKLFFWQQDHCRLSHYEDIERAKKLLELS